MAVAVAVTVALVLLILTVFYHAQQGVQVVIEDYISTHWQRTTAIVVVTFLCLQVLRMILPHPVLVADGATVGDDSGGGGVFERAPAG